MGVSRLYLLRIICAALGLVILLIISTGGAEFFTLETLGRAFDSQAEHLLRGDPGVDRESIAHEAFFVNGETRMYFGPFPALLRIGFNSLYPDGAGRWSRFSGAIAGLVALCSFFLVLTRALSRCCLPTAHRTLMGCSCLVGFALASPLPFLLGNLSIYNESMLWAFAWSMGAFYFVERIVTDENSSCWALAGFSIAAGAALHSRVTFGLPLFLLSPLLLLSGGGVNTRWRATFLLLPLLIAGGLYVGFSYWRFGSVTGISFSHYINAHHRNYVADHGAFNLDRVAYGFLEYFNARLPEFTDLPPFVEVYHYWFSHDKFALPYSELYLSVLWGSSWLVLGAILGFGCVFQRHSSWTERGISAAFFVQFVLILSFTCTAQRYSAELYPFLIYLFLVLLRKGGLLLRWYLPVLPFLVIASLAINLASTLSWLAYTDQNVLPSTRAILRRMLDDTELEAAPE